MMRIQALKHEFVSSIPRELTPGILYISMECATAMHSCCCGCGEQVVTPFTPTDWKMTFDGATVSIHPSVGNWNQQCRSHYIISKGKVIEAGPWSQAQVDAEQRRDRQVKAKFYGQSTRGDSVESSTDDAEAVGKGAAPTRVGAGSVWSMLRRWLLP